MKRVLKIDKFRNIGLKNTEQLVLNQSMEKGKMGNLVVLIGANNSGKSNVLNAILTICSEFEEFDRTTLSYDSKDRIPTITLATYDQSVEYSLQYIYGKDDPIVKYPETNVKRRLASDENNVELCAAINTATAQFSEFEPVRKVIVDCQNTFVNNKASSDDKYLAEQQLFHTLKSIKQNVVGLSSFRTLWRNLVSRSPMFTLVGYVNDTSDVSELDKAAAQYRSKFGVEFVPEILYYEEEGFSDSDLSTDYENFGEADFIKKALKSINISEQEVRNAYQSFTDTNSKGCLASFERTINKKLKAVARDFNKLYYVDDDTYSFEMSFESEKIYFSIMRNGDAMPLDYQSTGFQWFFNLYFNLLVDSDLKAGDIIIMDEPATNLHVQGQCELRKFLKDFAVKNDITIILATHSPFLIDMDYLDELRVVSSENNISSINNDFSTIDLDDPDSLKPIKKALTVSNYILTDPDKKVVFVEGITDYNYMTAFKKYFGVDDVVFLPIKGVGDGKSADIKAKQQDIIKRLLEIRKHGPILMVDGDKAGYAMQKNSEGKSELEVFTLKDVSETFTEIESLFTQEDLKKLGLIDKNGKAVKHSSDSSIFKTYTDVAKTVSKETIANFQKVFDYIKNL